MSVTHAFFFSDEQQSDHCVVAGMIKILLLPVDGQRRFTALPGRSVEGLCDVLETSETRLPAVASIDLQLHRTTVFTYAPKGRNDEVPHLYGREFDHVGPARN